jgi:hypothetical protein
MSIAAEFDAIIFYYWLDQRELNNIFEGKHKWWFMHGMSYRTCVFYGPSISQYTVYSRGPMKIAEVPSSMVEWSQLRHFLAKQALSKSPILSVVVETNIAPTPEEVKDSKMPVECIIADTHHMCSPITTALRYLEQVSPINVSVSHSPHRRILSDCLGMSTSPLAYSPRRATPRLEQRSAMLRREISYYGSVSDAYHPERSYIIERLLNNPVGKKILKTKPRLPPPKWELSVSQDLASFTCSLNGFPSVQSYIPLMYGTCLISDHLSPESDLGKLLIHGENCLLYSSFKEALDILKFAQEQPLDVAYIGKRGQKTFYEYQPSISQLLISRVTTISKLDVTLCSPEFKRRPDGINGDAIRACFAYEIIQEIHRLSRRVFVDIRGNCECAVFLDSYLKILPRAVKRVSSINQYCALGLDPMDCIVEISALPLDERHDNNIERLIILKINGRTESDPKVLESCSSINPNASLYPFYKGMTFDQQLPSSIDAYSRICESPAP